MTFSKFGSSCKNSTVIRQLNSDWFICKIYFLTTVDNVVLFMKSEFLSFLFTFYVNYSYQGYELDDLIVTGQVTSSSIQRFLVQTDDESNIKSGVIRTGKK